MQVIIHRPIGGPLAIHYDTRDCRGYPRCWCQPLVIDEDDAEVMGADLIDAVVDESTRRAIN